MDKKDIYEHLAKIYLDASSKKKGHTKGNRRFKTFFFTALSVIFTLSAILFTFYPKNKRSNLKPAITSQFVFVLDPNLVRINFNFDQVKKEIYALNLNQLDLTRFKALEFSARKANFDDKVVLKIEFTNTLKETAEVVVTDLTSFRWQDCKIFLSDFKNIKHWQEMQGLSFLVEEKDTANKHGIVYIDNIRLLR